MKEIISYEEFFEIEDKEYTEKRLQELEDYWKNENQKRKEEYLANHSKKERKRRKKEIIKI